MFLPYRKYIIAFFGILAVLAVFFALRLSFTFDIEQIFPEEDEDLTFFQSFIEDFESDANFLMIALEHEPDVFDSAFLDRVHQAALDMRGVDRVVKAQTLSMAQYPVKTPFGITGVPVLHRKTPAKYARDKDRILNDPRFVHNLISEDGSAIVIALKVTEELDVPQSHSLMDGVREVLSRHELRDYHMLGRGYFTSDIVKLQGREFFIVFLAAGVLVLIILALLLRKPIGVAVALSSIGLGLLIFMGVLGAIGRQLTPMSAFYPVLMLIVGTSDVIHIMSKYADELQRGQAKRQAMITTIKQIGMATLLTSVTTAVGFVTLATSKVAIIREFGLDSALGVMIAYVTTILFTTSVLSLFSVEQMMRIDRNGTTLWDRLLSWGWQVVQRRGGAIQWVSLVTIVLCAIGISKVSTNYTIADTLPIGAQVTEDFQYFEKEFAGFRPLEFAIEVQEPHAADDFAVLREVAKLEDHLETYGNIKAITSAASLYKSMHQMSNANKQSAYVFPEAERDFKRYRRMLKKFPIDDQLVMISKDKRRIRLSSRVADDGADSIREQGEAIDAWIAGHVDPNLLRIRQTGTGVIIDKNSIYVRDSLLYGLGLALLIVSGLMGLLFRDVKMLLLSIVPNAIPILFAAGLLGYLGIDLEAGVSIVFAIVFGIAVDDTIHFLSKFKLSRDKGHSVDEALQITYSETGKAILFTTIILFFGFLIMLFSTHPASRSIGVMISVTLASALVFDLTLLPVLIKKYIR